MQYIDTLGGPDTYNHYPTGWAVAFSTPFQMFKRYSQYSGGTCDPLVIHWPKGIKAKGQVRHQYHHATDIVPTILDVTGLEMPTTYRGVEQYPMNGVSMRYSFDDAEAPTTKTAAVLRDVGNPRNLGQWLEGSRFARADQRRRPFRPGQMGALPRRRGPFGVRRPRRRAPGQAEGAVDVWFEEADKNVVLPLDDRTATETADHPAAAVRAGAKPVCLLPRTRHRFPKASP